MSTKKEPVAFTKEEELLLQDFSRNVSTKSSALFYGNAFIVSAIPICECRSNAYGHTAYACVDIRTLRNLFLCSRALLENSYDGSVLYLCPLHRHHMRKYLLGGFRLQEHQICSQTQGDLNYFHFYLC
jgi:Translocon-associated protein, gamma subunit (TRAP-gamma)